MPYESRHGQLHSSESSSTPGRERCTKLRGSAVAFLLPSFLLLSLSLPVFIFFRRALFVHSFLSLLVFFSSRLSLSVRRCSLHSYSYYSSYDYYYYCYYSYCLIACPPTTYRPFFFSFFPLALPLCMIIIDYIILRSIACPCHLRLQLRLHHPFWLSSSRPDSPPLTLFSPVSIRRPLNRKLNFCFFSLSTPSSLFLFNAFRVDRITTLRNRFVHYRVAEPFRVAPNESQRLFKLTTISNQSTPDITHIHTHTLTRSRSRLHCDISIPL